MSLGTTFRQYVGLLDSKFTNNHNQIQIAQTNQIWLCNKTKTTKLTLQAQVTHESHVFFSGCLFIVPKVSNSYRIVLTKFQKFKSIVNEQMVVITFRQQPGSTVYHATC